MATKKKKIVVGGSGLTQGATGGVFAGTGIRGDDRKAARAALQGKIQEGGLTQFGTSLEGGLRGAFKGSGLTPEQKAVARATALSNLRTIQAQNRPLDPIIPKPIVPEVTPDFENIPIDDGPTVFEDPTPTPLPSPEIPDGGGGGGGTDFGSPEDPFDPFDDFREGIPGPATDTLLELYGLDRPAAGGPTFGGFGSPGEDELTRLINERTGSIISGEGLPSTAGVEFGDAASAGMAELGNFATGANLNDPLNASIRNLTSLADDGGLDSDLVFQVRQSLRENLEGEARAQNEALMDDLASRRITGGGGEIVGRGDIRKDLAIRSAGALRDFSTELARSAQDRRVAAATAAGQLGSEFRGQGIQAAEAVARSGIALRDQDIKAVQADLAAQLGAIESATGRALGIGDLALRNLIMEQDFIQFLMDDQFRRAEFLEATAQARQGQESNMISLLLQFLGQVQQGQVD
jgi:hypothetical protein